MLALDSTLGCIEASESEILELYRSATVTRISSSSAKPEKVEAYVCAIKKKSQVKVYLALVADDRKIFVYTKQGKADSESDYQQTVERAIACARSLGFSPEPVELSYSPAMREVVLRTTKILRPPGSKAGAYLKHGLSGAPILPIAKAAQPPLPPTDAPPMTTPHVPATSPAVGTTAATVEPSQELELRGQVLALEQTLAELGQELSAVAAERDAHALLAQQTSELQLAAAAELADAQKEYARLGAERDELVRYKEQCDGLGKEKDDLEGQLREMRGQHQSSVAELSSAREECARLIADRDALEQAANGAEKASSELVSLRKEVAGLSKRCEEAERLNHELGEERAALAETLSQSQREVEILTAQRAEALQNAEQVSAANAEAGVQTEAVRRELAALHRENEAALERITSLEQQKTAAEEELAALHRQFLVLTDKHRDVMDKAQQEHHTPVEAIETGQSTGSEASPPPACVAASGTQQEAPAAETLPQVADFTAGESTGDTPAGVAQLTEEIPPAMDGTRHSDAEFIPAPAETLPAPAEKQQVTGLTPLTDRERDFAYYSSMTEETTPVSYGVSDFPPCVDLEPDSSPAADQAPYFTPLADLQGNDFFSASDTESDPIRFLLSAKLDAIEYSKAEDLVELHQSINNANLSPDGKGQENCRGYICSLKKEEAVQVFAAIHGTQSGRTSVYLPEEQPRDEAGYAKAIRAAIGFAEEVGLMMEPVKIDPLAPQQREVIEKCPALRKVG